jgi:hypothetical protein
MLAVNESRVHENMRKDAKSIFFRGTGRERGEVDTNGCDERGTGGFDVPAAALKNAEDRDWEKYSVVRTEDGGAAAAAVVSPAPGGQLGQRVDLAQFVEVAPALA